MVYIVKQKIHGREYYYLRESVRKGKKVVSRTICYLGKTREEAEKKAKEVMESMKKKVSSEKESAERDLSSKPSLRKLKKLNPSIEELATFCKRRGFVYPSAEIYGGYSGFWDFGVLGAELKKNIKDCWWKFYVYGRDDIVGIDGSIITSPKVWEASGHVENFNDIFVICKKCHKANKVDAAEIGKVRCPCGGEYDFENAKKFKLMFETFVGEGGKAYLRPETAQLIFTNFKFVYGNSRLKLPCGIAQIGKAFRNEISPRDFLFRCREFEQMEIEYFIKENQSCPYEIPDVEILIYSAEAQEKGMDAERMSIRKAYKKGIIKNDWHAYWLANCFLWFKGLGANPERFRLRQHRKEELAHYSSDCWDLEYEFPFGWKELQGIADRGNYDLRRHEEFSKKDLKLFDEKDGKKFLPHVICEPSLGVERAFLVFMFDSYFSDVEKGNIVLRLHPKLAPIKAAVFPIVKKKEFEDLAEKIVNDLKKEWNVVYDRAGSIGRRYARNDEIGTPYCITIDGDSLKRNDVTIRDRDTTLQVRVKINELKEVLRRLIEEGVSLEEVGDPI